MPKCPVCGGYNTAVIEYNDKRPGVLVQHGEYVLTHEVKSHVCLYCGVMFISKDECRNIRESKKRGVSNG